MPGTKYFTYIMYFNPNNSVYWSDKYPYFTEKHGGYIVFLRSFIGRGIFDPRSP